MSMRDLERIAARHELDHGALAFRDDLVQAFERAMRRGMPLPHCCNITIGMVIGAMTNAAGIERTRQELLPSMIESMNAVVDVLASPEAQGNA
jgi:hypothetical protein